MASEFLTPDISEELSFIVHIQKMGSGFLIPVFAWGERNSLDQNQPFHPNNINVNALSLEIHGI